VTSEIPGRDSGFEKFLAKATVAKVDLIIVADKGRNTLLYL
jgi:hypothetical protein